VDNGTDDDDDEAEDAAAPAPETGEYTPAREDKKRAPVETGEFDPMAVTATAATDDEPMEDEFSGQELTGGIDGVSSPEDAIRHLRKSEARDDITRVLVSPFLAGSSLSVLFLVRQGNFMALRASGSGARDEEIRAMVVSLANPSLLQRSYKQKTVLRAPAESDPLQQMISGHLRVGAPEEVCVAPVVLAGRVVNVLCIQSKTGRRFDKDASDQIQQVCEEASSAYTRLIQKSKK